MQDRSQGGIFFSYPQQKLSYVCQISMVRQPIRIYLPMFWTWPAPRIFLKLLKVSIALLRWVNNRAIIYRENMLLLGRILQEIIMARDIDFSITTFRFCDQPEEMSPSSCETNIVSSLNNR